MQSDSSDETGFKMDQDNYVVVQKNILWKQRQILHIFEMKRCIMTYEERAWNLLKERYGFSDNYDRKTKWMKIINLSIKNKMDFGTKIAELLQFLKRNRFIKNDTELSDIILGLYFYFCLKSYTNSHLTVLTSEELPVSWKKVAQFFSEDTFFTKNP